MKTLTALLMLVSIGLAGCHHHRHHDNHHGHDHDKEHHCPPGQHKKGKC